MEDVQIITANEYRKEKRSGLKIFVIVVLLVIISIAVAGSSYYLGIKFNREPEISSDTQDALTPTSGLTLPQTTLTSTPTASPSATYKISPTRKLSPTPKASPTPKKSPTPTPTVNPLLKSKILPSIASLDGYRSSDGSGNTNLEIRAGRNSSLVTRGFISFEISDIPTEAKIQSASLRLYQAKIVGSPYTAGGSLVIDHLTYGDALDSSDYASPALTSNFTTLADSEKIAWYEADVTARFKDDLANARWVSQYRIHFQKEVTGGDATGDFVYFESQDNSLSTKNTPQLVIKYY